MSPEAFPSSVRGIIELYDRVVRRVRHEAEVHEQEGTRAYGGVIRMSKGRLVESIGKSVVSIAWGDLGGEPDRLSFNDTANYRVMMESTYLDRLPADVREHVMQKRDRYFYKAHVDIHAFIDGVFILGVECKAYTENAMLKRILYDFSLLKTIHSDLKCCLLQLESQLGGDYSDPLASPSYGSESTHTLMSYSEAVELDILTLLHGERNIKRPIHDPAHFKPLTEQSVEAAIRKIQNHLRPSL